MKELQKISLKISQGRVLLALMVLAAVPSSGQMTANVASTESVASSAAARAEENALAETRDDKSVPEDAVSAPTGRAAALALPHRDATESHVEDLFAGHSWYVAPPPQPPAPPAPPVEPPAPTAPPLPYTFMGSYAQDGAPTVYFLVKSDRVYDVKVGDTLDETYSIDAVTNGSMSITYKPLNIQQTLAVGGGT